MSTFGSLTTLGKKQINTISSLDSLEEDAQATQQQAKVACLSIAHELRSRLVQAAQAKQTNDHNLTNSPLEIIHNHIGEIQRAVICNNFQADEMVKSLYDKLNINLEQEGLVQQIEQFVDEVTKLAMPQPGATNGSGQTEPLFGAYHTDEITLLLQPDECAKYLEEQSRALPNSADDRLFYNDKDVTSLGNLDQQHQIGTFDYLEESTDDWMPGDTRLHDGKLQVYDGKEFHHLTAANSTALTQNDTYLQLNDQQFIYKFKGSLGYHYEGKASGKLSSGALHAIFIQNKLHIPGGDQLIELGPSVDLETNNSYLKLDALNPTYLYKYENKIYHFALNANGQSTIHHLDSKPLFLMKDQKVHIYDSDSKKVTPYKNTDNFAKKKPDSTYNIGPLANKSYLTVDDNLFICQHYGKQIFILTANPDGTITNAPLECSFAPPANTPLFTNTVLLAKDHLYQYAPDNKATFKKLPAANNAADFSAGSGYVKLTDQAAVLYMQDGIIHQAKSGALAIPFKITPTKDDDLQDNASYLALSNNNYIYKTNNQLYHLIIDNDGKGSRVLLTANPVFILKGKKLLAYTPTGKKLATFRNNDKLAQMPPSSIVSQTPPIGNNKGYISVDENLVMCRQGNQLYLLMLHPDGLTTSYPLHGCNFGFNHLPQLQDSMFIHANYLYRYLPNDHQVFHKFPLATSLAKFQEGNFYLFSPDKQSFYYMHNGEIYHDKVGGVSYQQHKTTIIPFAGNAYQLRNGEFTDLQVKYADFLLNGSVHIDSAIVQGKLGNCFLLAAINIFKRNPNYSTKFNNMFSMASNGDYIVSLYCENLYQAKKAQQRNQVDGSDNKYKLSYDAAKKILNVTIKQEYMQKTILADPRAARSSTLNVLLLERVIGKFGSALNENDPGLNSSRQRRDSLDGYDLPEDDPGLVNIDEFQHWLPFKVTRTRDMNEIKAKLLDNSQKPFTLGVNLNNLYQANPQRYKRYQHYGIHERHAFVCTACSTEVIDDKPTLVLTLVNPWNTATPEKILLEDVLKDDVMPVVTEFHERPTSTVKNYL